MVKRHLASEQVHFPLFSLLLALKLYSNTLRCKYVVSARHQRIKSFQSRSNIRCLCRLSEYYNHVSGSAQSWFITGLSFQPDCHSQRELRFKPADD